MRFLCQEDQEICSFNGIPRVCVYPGVNASVLVRVRKREIIPSCERRLVLLKVSDGNMRNRVFILEFNFTVIIWDLPSLENISLASMAFGWRDRLVYVNFPSVVSSLSSAVENVHGPRDVELLSLVVIK